MAKNAYRIEHEQFIPQPVDRVFGFFADARHLEAITPGFLHFRIVTPPPIVMQPGTLIDYRLRLFGIPIGWRTLIEEFDPPRRFVDIQLTGPYRRWHHLHEFHSVEGGTQMVDRVDYELAFGAVGRMAHGLFVARTLRRIFNFRQKRIIELLNSRSNS